MVLPADKSHTSWLLHHNRRTRLRQWHGNALRIGDFDSIHEPASRLSPEWHRGRRLLDRVLGQWRRVDSVNAPVDAPIRARSTMGIQPLHSRGKRARVHVAERHGWRRERHVAVADVQGGILAIARRARNLARILFALHGPFLRHPQRVRVPGPRAAGAEPWDRGRVQGVRRRVPRCWHPRVSREPSVRAHDRWHRRRPTFPALVLVHRTSSVTASSTSRTTSRSTQTGSSGGRGA